jgi:tetratricopeptide (TPR) repeat protein
MTARRIVVVAILAAVALAAAAEETKSPRDMWSLAANAAVTGDYDAAIKNTNDLLTAGRALGISSFPTYAASAAAMARDADRLGKKELADWAAKTADQLDPKSPAVSFSAAERARTQGNWPKVFQESLTGFVRVFKNYRTRLLSQVDLLIAATLALALTAAIFAIALFIRYAHSMGHDFRELLATRLHGGSVSVLAFALLFLPLFLWLSPVWLVLYWFIIFFGYANKIERALIILFTLVIAALPIMLDRAATWTAGVDNPIVSADVNSAEAAYHPESLRRMQELATLVSDNDLVQILLGNLELQEGNDQQAEIYYKNAQKIRDSAGANVNLGNRNFLNGDFAAAITFYERAEQLDPKLAIAFYDDSVANGEMYKFDVQGQKLEQAKRLDTRHIERLTQTPPTQKIVVYTPPVADAWAVAESLAEKGVAKTLFGTYAYFDLQNSALNPITAGAIAALLLEIIVWFRRRNSGYANACIKCGRTFCRLCKSARESATYCTQCIHIYLKRDGVSLDTKRAKLEEVSDHQNAMTRRNKLFATFLPGSAQVLEGRTIAGVIGMLLFLLFLSVAVLTGRLAPALGPVADTTHLFVRILMLLLAAVTWFFLSLPVYRRRVTIG